MSECRTTREFSILNIVRGIMKLGLFAVKHFFIILLILSQGTVSSSVCHASAGISLSRDEIEKFIQDTPVFVNEVKKIHEDTRMIHLFLHPEEVSQDKVVLSILEKLNWVPEKYAYIFSHVIIAGFIRDMGQFGDKKLAFLKDQLSKWEKSNEPEPERTRTIEGLREGVRDLEVIVERTKKIPKKELLLMWEYREELNGILMGKLPIGKRGFKALK